MTEELKNALRSAKGNSPIYVGYGSSADRDQIRNVINVIAEERNAQVRIMSSCKRNTMIVMFSA